MFENELKSTASEDILNIPIGALNLSSDIFRVINTNRIYKNNIMRPLIETIGDLLRVGEENFQNMLIRRKFELSDIDEAYIQINEKLAYLGLRFPDSEFTADEIRITSLELSPREAEFMKHLYKKVRDVNQLCLLGKRKLERELEKSNMICNLQKIEDEVEKLGMFIEGFKVKNINDKAKIFPLNKYEKYLSEHTKRERCGKITELSNGVPIEQVLTMENAINDLHKLGIYTVDELVSKLYSEKTLIGHNLYNRIRRDLAKHNLLIMGDCYEIVNSQVFSKKRTMDLKIPTKIPAKDINDMTEDERKEFLSLSLEDFDLDPLAIEYLHKLNIFKVGDFASFTRKEIYDLADESKVIPDYITDSFFKYGVVNKVDTTKNEEDNTNNEPTNEIKKRIYDSGSTLKRNYNDLSDKDKQKFLSQSLLRFGVDYQLVKLLKSKLIIKSVKDFIVFKPKDIISLIGENAYNAICNQLDNFGLDVEKENKKVYGQDEESDEPNF